jgi:hypothetical protein
MGQFRLRMVCVALLVLLAGAVQAAATLPRDDFQGGNSGWSWTTGGGSNAVEFSHAGEYLYLHNGSNQNRRFPLVGRNDAFDDFHALPNPYWRLSLRFRFLDHHPFGTTIAAGTATFNANDRDSSGAIRTNWENILRLHHFGSNFQAGAYGVVHYTSDSTSAWHTAELDVSGSSYVFRLDGVDRGSGAVSGVPESLWMGNYSIQGWNGDWTDIQVDWVQVDADLETPSTTATPSGTPGNAGWWRSDVSVSLVASDAWSGVAATSYRIDGGAWMPYGGPFAVTGEGTHLVEYRSSDNAGNVEGVQSLAVNIDPTPPATSATPAGTVGCAGWYTSTVQVTLSASDATSGVALTQYQVNGGGWQAYGGPLTLGDGVHTVDYRSTDVAGNPETAGSLSLAIDTSPPATSSSLSGAAGDNGWYRSNVDVTLSASDALSGLDETLYRVDGGSWQTYAGGFTVSGDGTHTLEYYSTDAACNAETATTEQVRIDTVDPASAISSLSDGEWISETVSVAGAASDATSGVALVDVSTDGGGSWQTASGTTSWSETWDTTTVPDGDYDVCTRGRDVAGNVESVSCITVHVDNTAPATTPSRSGTAGCNGWYQSAVDVTLSASDGSGIGVSSTWYRVDGGGWQAYAGAFTVSGQGAHTVEYYSTDGLGNTEATQSLAVAIDSVAPSTSATRSGTLGSGGWYVSSVDVTLSASDATSGVDVTEYRVDGGAWTPYSGVLTISTDGTHAVEYRSSDNACNTETTHSLAVAIDTVPPTTWPTRSGPAGCAGWYTGPVQVSLNASDATSGVDATEYRVNGGAWQTYSGAFTISTEGTTTVGYRSSDNAGNVGSATSFTVQIDTVAPSTTAARSGTPGSGGWYVSSVDVTLSASDATSGVDVTEYRIDGGTWQAYNGAFTIATDGAHLVEYRSTDVACNAEAVRSLAVAIDTLEPATALDLDGTPGNAGWWRSAVTATLSASDATSGVGVTEYDLDAGGWTPYGAPFSIAGEGGHDLAYRSTDVAGNQEAAASAQVHIDTVLPSTAASIDGSLGLNGWYTATVTVTLTATDATSGVDATYLDGAAYSAPVLYTADGSYSLPYHATDVAGNAEPAGMVAFDLDTVPPEVSVIGGRFCPRCGQTLIIQPSASDATSGLFVWRLELLDGATVVISWMGTSAPASIPWNGRDASGDWVADGTYDLVLWAQDVAGWTAVAGGQAIVRPRPPSPPPPPPAPTPTPAATLTPWPTWTSTPTELPTATPTLRPGETPEPTSVPPEPSPAPTETPTPTPAPVAAAAPAVVLRVGVFQDDDGDATRAEVEPGLAGLEVYVGGEGGWNATWLADARGVVTITLPGAGVYEVSLLTRPREGTWAATTRLVMAVQVEADRSVVILPAGEDEALPVGTAPTCVFAFGLAPRAARVAAVWLPLAATTLLVLATLGAALDRRAEAIRELERALGGAR